MIRIGTDVGGTFTDFVAVGPDGNPSVWKVPSVPDAPARAVLDGLPDLLGASQIDPVDVAFFGHATTIATNSLLERKGANVALLTTAGCRDVLEIGRLARPDDKLYDLHYRPHPPLVPRRRRLEVLERVDATGAVVIPLDEHMVVAMADELRSAGVHAVAVAFLFSYLNPSHERRVREIFADRAPGLDISLSCEIAPNAGEYERTSSTVVNASVQTIMATYLDALSTDLSATGVVATLRIMQSNGGLSGLDGVLARPVATLLSGPCAGAIAGRHTAAVAGIGEAINLDMGGTSCDISLVIEGDIGLRDYQHIAGDVIRLPSVDLNTIGAGGGSVAWIDPAGILRVGPESAGARPGPVCYGRGGDRVTVTDADLVLGILGEESILGAALRLDVAAAREACERLGAQLSLDAEHLAWGVRTIVNAAMTNEIRGVSIARGHDPRDFALIAFGGAGPAHAAEIADDLRIDTVIVPAHPGCHSAYGLAIADVVYEHVTSIRRTTVGEVDITGLARTVATLEDRGMAQLDQDGVARDRRMVRRALGMRYLGQEGILVVPFPTEEMESEDSLARTLESFHEMHSATFGFRADDDPVEIVDVRVTVIATSRLVERSSTPIGGDFDAASVRREKRMCRFLVDRATPTDVFLREAIPAGATIEGPAILEQLDATTVIPPHWTGSVSANADLVMRRAGIAEVST